MVVIVALPPRPRRVNNNAPVTYITTRAMAESRNNAPCMKSWNRMNARTMNKPPATENASRHGHHDNHPASTRHANIGTNVTATSARLRHRASTA